MVSGGLEEIDMGKSQETSVCVRKRAGSGAAMRLSSSYKLRRTSVAYTSCMYYTPVVCLLIGLQDPTPLTQTHPDFPGMLCIWARWAGCPRRLPNKKLTKSYTRYPVGGASGPVRRSLWPGPAVPGRSMAVHAPDPGLYCAQRLLHSSIALNGRRGSPPFQGLGW